MLEPRIRMYWSKKEKDLMVNWEPGTCRATARYLMHVITLEVMEELDRRGFDTTTIRFQIRRKPINVLDRIVREIDAKAGDEGRPGA